MIRGFHLADIFTLGNAACGVLSLFQVIAHVQAGAAGGGAGAAGGWHLLAAMALIPFALALDILDGRIARWRRKHSVMGRELDSLADVISFGVAPAVIAYGAGMRGLWDELVLVYFVGCGVSRLARFNVTADELATESGKVKYFEGTPIPTSIFLVALLAVAAAVGHVGDALWLGAVDLGPGTLHPLVLSYAVSGSLMISKTVRIPKL